MNLFLQQYEYTIITYILGDKYHNKNNIIDSLEPEMFTSNLYRKFFKEAKRLKEENKEINVFTICENISLEEQNQMRHIVDQEDGNLYFVCNVNWEFYVDEIKKAYLERLVQNANSVDDIPELNKLKSKFAKNTVLSPIGQNSYKILENYYDTMYSNLETGYKNLDDIIGSFQQGELVIVAGATSSGKSLFMMNVALNIAKQERQVDIYSLEMAKEALINRLVCAEIGLNADGFKKHNWTSQQIDTYADYINKDLKKLPININNVGAVNLQDLITSVKKSSADVIFIDYLGLIRNANKLDRYEKISEISMELKTLANDSNKVIIALHQISRANANRTDKRPILSDLRDSGQIEQDADSVLFVYRPAYYFEDQPKELMQIIVAKNRSGSLGIADLNCNLQTQKITNRIKID